MVSVAWPAALTGPVPSVAEPSRNVTVPVGVTSGTGEETVAVKVIAWPNTAGLADAATAVAVPTSPGLTTSDRAADVAARKLPSPPYATVIGWLPTARPDVVNDAVPPLSVPVPIVVAPSEKVTAPVGVPAPGAPAVTVAVKVTACPAVAGFGDEPIETVVAAGATVSARAAEVLPRKLASPP